MVLAFLTAALCLSVAQPKADSAAARPGGLELTFSAVMQVEEPAKASDRMVARTEAMGGFFFRRSQEGLELRLPMVKADAWIDSLAGDGLVVDRNLQTRSLDGEWVEQTSRLKAKQASLNDYYAMLKVSGDSTIFIIQNAITQLQGEIEQTTQEIQKLEDRMRFARISVSFRFPDRTAPLASGVSRFDWLNGLDLRNLLERFDYAQE
jgi:Domain of unknown function (DUF4349)